MQVSLCGMVQTRGRRRESECLLYSGPRGTESIHEKETGCLYKYKMDLLVGGRFGWKLDDSLWVYVYLCRVSRRDAMDEKERQAGKMWLQGA